MRFPSVDVIDVTKCMSNKVESAMGAGSVIIEENTILVDPFTLRVLPGRRILMRDGTQGDNI